MTTVGPDDDEIRRFVLRRYAYDPQRRERRHYDPQRRERRHQVVAVLGDRAEFETLLHELSGDLRRRRADGEHQPIPDTTSASRLEVMPADGMVPGRAARDL